jgi:hypothetical protein
MQMSLRIRRSWDELSLGFVGAEDGDTAANVRSWLLSSFIRIASPVAEAVARTHAFQRLLHTPLERLPTSRRAVEVAKRLAQSEPPADPMLAVDRVADIAWTLAVYRVPSDSCPHCQGDLDVWTASDDDREILLLCNVLGCVWTSDLTRSHRPLGPDPAWRDAILSHYQEADLVLQRSRG